MPDRSYSSESAYRYGFNSKEKDKEVVQYDYGFRIYDPRLGRFKSVDPLIYSYPYYTPYQFAGNMPIVAIDLDGLEQYVVIYYKDQKGNTYKMEIRTIKANKIIVDQNVQAIKKGTTETDGNKIAFGNVLVFEVYNEGTKKESLKIVDSRNNENSILTKEEKEVFESNNKLENETDTRYAYPFTDNSKYESQDFDNAKFYSAIKLFNQTPPAKFILNASFRPGTSKIDDEAGLKAQLSNVIKYLKENPNKKILILPNIGCSNSDPNCGTVDGKKMTDKEVFAVRGKRIADLLIKSGVPAKQISLGNGKVVKPTKDGVPVNFQILKK